MDLNPKGEIDLDMGSVCRESSGVPRTMRTNRLRQLFDRPIDRELRSRIGLLGLRLRIRRSIHFETPFKYYSGRSGASATKSSDNTAEDPFSLARSPRRRSAKSGKIDQRSDSSPRSKGLNFSI
jgi:hypothetical protein